MIQKAERIIEAYQKVKPAGCGVIAMDGRAAAGKTTLAEELAVTLGGAVVHMDDFFLPGELRTPERLAAPGGNVHAERFAEEVLPYLRRGEAFRYRRFDCHRMDYNGWVEIPTVPVIIVEGAYSQHPRFGGYADLTVFCDIAPEEQKRRICSPLTGVTSDSWDTPAGHRVYDACRGFSVSWVCRDSGASSASSTSC